jgi:Chaperone of endosialidase
MTRMNGIEEVAVPRRNRIAAIVIGLAAFPVFAISPLAPKPDALLSIDMNRSAVVDKIVAQWSKELPVTQAASFHSKLMGLRADQLLAANLSGSFDGVLELLNVSELSLAGVRQATTQGVEIGQASATGDNAKALGEIAQDLVYTPIAPCRVFDTRTPGAPFVSNGLTSGVTRAFDIDGANLSAQGGAMAGCNVPSAAKAVVLAFSPISPPTTGWFVGAANDGSPLPASTLFNFSSALTLTTFTVVMPMSGQAGGDIRLEARGVSAYSMDGVGDVTGYFMPPNRNGDGLRVFAGNGLPNIINGDSSNTLSNSGGQMFGATISGGYSNTVGDSTGGNGWYSTIAGGRSNSTTSDGATVSGGSDNVASGARATVGGGAGNTASGINASVVGGSGNSAIGVGGSVGGGYSNTAYGNYSFAGGRQAATGSFFGLTLTPDHGSFVWADSNANGASGQAFSSTASDQFAVRARGGVAFRVGSTEFASQGVGCSLPAGGAASWSCSSDRNLKEAVRAISGKSILDRISALPISSWQFKGTSRRHIGPMAQDFYAAFGLGIDDKNITVSDVGGVALAAIQGLNQKLIAESKRKDAKISALEKKAAKLEAIERASEAMKSELSAIKKKLGL